MKKKSYESSVPLGTPMLTNNHIEMRVAWAQAHLEDNWDRTIFTDETAFDLFETRSVGGIRTVKDPSVDYQNHVKKLWRGVAFLEREKHPYFALLT